jgi:hypothetical protein
VTITFSPFTPVGTVPMPGLDGSTLSGFLSAIGVLRCYADAKPEVRVHLAWDDGDTPVYYFDKEQALDDVLEVCQQASEPFVGANTWKDRTSAPTSGNSSGKGFGEVEDVVAHEKLSIVQRYEVVHQWNPWVTIKTAKVKGLPVFAPAAWARNSPNKTVFDVHKSMSEAAEVLQQAVVPENLLEKWWAEVVGTRPLARAPEWKKEVGASSAPTSGSSSLFLTEYISAYDAGIAKGEFNPGTKTEKAGVSTKVNFLYSPAITFLTGMGLCSITSHGGKMPGEEVGGERTVRWALWNQPLPLVAISHLVWNKALDRKAEETSGFCGGRNSPLRAAHLHEAQGAESIVPITTRTKKRKPR